MRYSGDWLLSIDKYRSMNIRVSIIAKFEIIDSMQWYLSKSLLPFKECNALFIWMILIFNTKPTYYSIMFSLSEGQSEEKHIYLKTYDTSINFNLECISISVQAIFFNLKVDTSYVLIKSLSRIFWINKFLNK